MKKFIALFLLILMLLMLFTACGHRYKCMYCEKKYSESNICEPITASTCVCMDCARAILGDANAEELQKEIRDIGIDNYIRATYGHGSFFGF